MTGNSNCILNDVLVPITHKLSKVALYLGSGRYKNIFRCTNLKQNEIAFLKYFAARSR